MNIETQVWEMAQQLRQQRRMNEVSQRTLAALLGLPSPASICVLEKEPMLHQNLKVWAQWASALGYQLEVKLVKVEV